MHLDTLIGVLSCFPFNATGDEPRPPTTITDLRLVCKRFNLMVKKHACMLPRQRMNGFHISIDDQPRCKNGIIDWPGHANCSCRAKLEARAQMLVGQLLFPNLAPTVPILFKVDYEPKLHVRNKLNLQTAWDLVHMNAHIRNVYFSWLGIESRQIVDITLNPLLFDALYPLCTKYFRAIYEDNEAIYEDNEITALQHVRPAFDARFIKAQKIQCFVDLKSDTGLTMDELLRFLSHGRMADTEKIWISIYIPNDRSRITVVDTIIKYFTKRVQNFGRAFPMIRLSFWIESVNWPTAIAKPDDLQPGSRYSFPMTNERANKQFHIELKASWDGGVQMVKMRF